MLMVSCATACRLPGFCRAIQPAVHASWLQSEVHAAQLQASGAGKLACLENVLVSKLTVINSTLAVREHVAGFNTLEVGLLA